MANLLERLDLPSDLPGLFQGARLVIPDVLPSGRYGGQRLEDVFLALAQNPSIDPELWEALSQAVPWGDNNVGAMLLGSANPAVQQAAQQLQYNATLKDEFSFLGDNFLPAMALLGIATGAAGVYGAFGAPSTLGTVGSVASTGSNLAQAAGAPGVLDFVGASVAPEVVTGGATGLGGGATAAGLAVPTAVVEGASVPIGFVAPVASSAPVAAAAGGATLAGIPLTSLIGPAITAGTGLVGNIIAGNAAGNAAETQAEAGRQANTVLRDLFLQQRADQLPFLQAGVNALPELSRLASTSPERPTYTPTPPLSPEGFAFTPPTADTLAQDPGYQFRLREGMKALERSASARGTLLSGGQQKAINNYAQESASQEFQNAYQRALGENQLRYGRAVTQNEQQAQRNADAFQTNFNVGQVTGNQQFNRLASLAGVGQTGANTLANVGAQYGSQASQLLQNIGNVNAAGQVAQGNALAGGVGAFSTAAQQFQQQMLLRDLLESQGLTNQLLARR